MRLTGWRDEDNNDDLNIGQTDRSLSAEAVIFPGSITIIKAATPEGSTSFPFTASPSPLSNFALVDDGTATNTKVFSNITTFQTYTVVEGAASGWTLSFNDPVCTLAGPSGGSRTGDVPTRTITIELQEAQDVTCTFVNSRQQGSIELRKDWIGTPSSVDLKIGTTAGGSEVDSELALTVDGTTGANTVNTGTYFVSEVVTNAANYDTTLACFNDNGAGTGGVANDGIQNGTEPAVSVGASDSVAVAQGADVVCTYTNTRKQGSIELRKDWIGTPSSVDLKIGTTAGGSEVDSELALTVDGTTGANTVNTGTYFVSEVVTNAANYDTTLACFNDNGAGTGGVANDGIQNGTEPAVSVGASDSVAVAQGADVVCTYTNTRKQGSIELRKDWIGTPSSVDLKIGTTAGGSEVDSELALTVDGTTGANTVNTGTYFVSEVVTNAANYDTTLACFNDNGAGTGGVANDGIQNGTEPAVSVGASDSVAVAQGADVVCTYTNTRKQGSIELRKDWIGTPSSVDLKIGTTAGGSEVDSELALTVDGTTGANTVNTGTYFVSEVVTNAANYDTTLACFNDNGAGTGGVANDGIQNGTEPAVSVGASDSFAVAQGTDIVCTYTNTLNRAPSSCARTSSARPATSISTSAPPLMARGRH